jgi:hypothetical protein
MILLLSFFDDFLGVDDKIVISGRADFNISGGVNFAHFAPSLHPSIATGNLDLYPAPDFHDHLPSVVPSVIAAHIRPVGFGLIALDLFRSFAPVQFETVGASLFVALLAMPPTRLF